MCAPPEDDLDFMNSYQDVKEETVNDNELQKSGRTCKTDVLSVIFDHESGEEDDDEFEYGDELNTLELGRELSKKSKGKGKGHKDQRGKMRAS